MQTEKVLVTVLGLTDRPGEETERIEITAPGTLSSRDRIRYLRYDEYPDESGEPVHTFVKLLEGSLEVIRSGMIRTRMVFETGRRYATSYATSFGSMQMEFFTHDTWLRSDDRSLNAGARYDLSINGEAAAVCEIRMEIRF